MKQEVYISIDIETDGPAAGINSMLSLGAAAFTVQEGQIGEWYQKIKPLPEAVRSEETMDWWQLNPTAWQEANKNQKSPFVSIPEFALWCESMKANGRLVAVAWPAAFDFSFVNYYLWKFARRNPLGFSCLDIRSYANGVFGAEGYYGTRGVVPEGDLYNQFKIPTEDLRPHFAVDDAIRQGRLFMAMLHNEMEKDHS
jgi:DNA polymerase III alpha subunit (gram-positive type)